MRRLSKYLKLAFSIFLVCLFVFPIYMQANFGEMDFEQILYVMISEGDGANTDMIFTYFWFALPYFIGFGLIAFVYHIFVQKEVTLDFKLFGKHYRKSLSFQPSLKKTLISSIAALLTVLAFVDYKFQVLGYVSERLNPGQIYEDYYVDPNDVSMEFPEDKQNLIYIVLESMNTNFSSMEVDEQTVNLIPNLEELANDNINFSNTNGFGGHVETRGLTWTAASLIGQTSGVPLQIPINSDDQSYGQDGEYLPGITTIGEVLADNGYKNYFLLGSDANFGGRETYFQTHGDYEILDLKYMKEQGLLPEDYYVFWGMEDSKMFNYAQEKLLEISQNDEPFNFTMLTVDSHFMDGYTDSSCSSDYSIDYANAIACSDSLISDFVSWVQDQDFYENTTIVIVADHNTMNNEFLQLTNSSKLSLYNVIINTRKEVSNSVEKNRNYTAMDMFPTTLSALGVDIDGNRLGLGVDLFSGDETILEIMGADTLSEELGKKSYYYEDNFFK